MADPVRTAKGTTANKTSSTTLTLASVTIADGAAVIVALSHDPETLNSVAWNGQTLTKIKEATNAGSVQGSVWARFGVTGATGSVVGTWNAAVVAKALAVEQVTNVTEADVSDSYSGYGDIPNSSSGTPPTTTKDVEYLFGMVAVESKDLDGTPDWTYTGSSTTTTGQMDGTATAGPDTNVYVATGYDIQSSAGQREAVCQIGASADWVCIFVSFKQGLYDESADDEIAVTDDAGRELTIDKRVEASAAGLPNAITIDGQEVTAECVYLGDDADGTDWDPTVGSVYLDLESGTAPSYDQPAPSPIDLSVKLNGGGYYEDASNALGEFASGDAGCVEVVLRPNAVAVQYIVNKVDATPQGWVVYQTISGSDLWLRASFYDSGSALHSTATLASYSPYYLHLFAAMAPGNASGLKLWVDGVAGNTGNAVSFPDLSNSFPFAIGARSSTGGSPSTANIVSVRMWRYNGWFTDAAQDEIAHLAKSRALMWRSDWAQLVDSVTRELTQSAIERSANDSLALTDQVLQAADYLREVQESASLTDQVLAWRDYERDAGDDAIAATDQAAAERELERSDDDAVALTDQADVALERDRSASDSLGLTDQATRTATLERIISEALALADAADRVLTGGEVIERSANDGLALTDQVLREAAYLRSAQDALAATDQAQTERAYERAAQDSAALTDSADAGLEAWRSASDGLALTDQAALAMELERVVQESVALTDQAPVERDYGRIVQESLALTDQVASEAAGTIIRSAADGLAATDQAAVERGYLRSVQESLALTDAAAAGGDVERSAQDGLALTDLAPVERDYLRAAADGLALTDQAAIDSEYLRSVTDALALTDQATLEGTTTRTTSDDLALTDSTAQETQAHRTAQDSLAVTDQAEREPDLGVQDSLAVTDQARVDREYLREAQDALALTDAAAGQIVAAGTIYRTAQDSLALTDAISQESQAWRTASDTIGIDDHAEVWRELLARDSIEITDSIAQVFWAMRIIDLYSPIWTGDYELAEQLVLAVGGNPAELWRYSGGAWEEISSEIPDSIFSGHPAVSSYGDIHPWQIFGVSPTDWWIGTGGDGLLIHYRNGTWEAFWSGNGLPAGFVTQDVIGIWGATPTRGAWSQDVYAVTADDRLLHYDGSTWTQDSLSDAMLSARPHSVNGIAASSQVLIGTMDGDVHVGESESWSTYASFTGTICSAFWLDPTNAWIGGDDGELYYSDDGGQTWAAQTTGIVGTPEVLGVWAANASCVWAVTEDGQIVHFDGTDWSVQHTGTEGWRGIWGADPNHVWVVGNKPGYTEGAVRSFNPSTRAWDDVSGDFPSSPVSGDEIYSVWATGEVESDGPAFYSPITTAVDLYSPMR